MQKTIINNATFAILAMLAFCFCHAYAKEAPPFQTVPMTLKASTILPATILKGNGYSVADQVSNDGFLNTYILESEYGELNVTGTDKLLARIQEIKATRALEDLERSDAFKDAAKGAVEGMVEGGKSLVTSPVDTSKRAAKGFGRWVSNVGRSFTSDDPDQENALATALGHDAAKRAYALEFGVDPYTDFEPFQERLGEVAQAATAGGLIAKMALDVGTEGTMVGTVVTVSSAAAMKDMIKDNPPGRLNELNRSRLEKMGIPDYQIHAFNRNYNYTAMERALLVEALRRMGDVKGREIFVAYSTAAPDEVIARYMQQTAEMMANYISDTGPADIVELGGQPILITRDGKAILASAVDYLVWTKRLSEIVEATSSAISDLPNVKSRELLIEGQVDPAVRAAFEGQDWKVKDHVGLAARDSLE